MKKYFLIICIPILISSCTEMLPDLSPDTPQGKQMVVIDYNLNIREIVEIDSLFQGDFQRSRGFDINDDGIDDFWFVASNEFGIFNTNRNFYLAVNGEYLAEAETKNVYNQAFFNANPGKILKANQLVGNTTIENSTWITEGYRYGAFGYMGAYEFVQFYAYGGGFFPTSTENYILASSQANIAEKGKIFSISGESWFCVMSFHGCLDEIYFSQEGIYFIAIKIKIDGKPHYGWLKLTDDKLVSAAYSIQPFKNVVTK